MKSELRNLTQMMAAMMRRFEGQSLPSIVQDSESHHEVPQNETPATKTKYVSSSIQINKETKKKVNELKRQLRK